MSSAPTCATCRFVSLVFVPHFSGEPGSVACSRRIPTWYCRRYPPTDKAFPPVTDEMWCGEYEPKPVEPFIYSTVERGD